MGRLVFVRSLEVKKTRNQENYCSLRLNLGRGGRFADVDAKVWGLDGLLCSGAAMPKVGDVLEIVDVREEEYQGRPQWIVRQYRVLADAEREGAMAEFIPPVQIDRVFYQKRLDDLIEQTDARRVAGMLVREFFDSAEFRETFYAAPAAVRHHQNYPGGLLEHTINVTSVALAIADAYAGVGGAKLSFNQTGIAIDRQTLIAAGLLHDIGKIETYKMAPLAEVTDGHMWEGHLAIGYAQVRARCEPLMATPPYPAAVDEARKLLHCILAHHGRLEFGSPTEPACAEAFILSQADMTDARLAEITEGAAAARAQNPEARWMPRNLHFPGGVFIGDWPEKID